jgi:uracil-DNA glycosylase
MRWEGETPPITFGANMNSSMLKKKINEYVSTCTLCGFHKNGRALPFFGNAAKYLIIGEAPHKEEIKQGIPFVGSSGKLLWDTINNLLGLSKDEFIVLNSVMCMPTIPTGKTIGKPTKVEIDSCIVKKTMVLSYLQLAYSIKNILILGNYPQYIFNNSLSGISAISGQSEEYCQYYQEEHQFIITYCLHPASCLYNGSNKAKFEKSIIAFGEAINLGFV